MVPSQEVGEPSSFPGEMPAWAAGFAGSSAPAQGSFEGRSWVLLTCCGLQRCSAKAGSRYLHPDQRKPSGEGGSGTVPEAGVLREALLLRPAPIPHAAGHLCFLRGSEDHPQSVWPLKRFPPLPPLGLLLLSFPFSFLFKVNLSDCYNVIVFLAPSVVSPSLAPGLVLTELKGGLS